MCSGQIFGINAQMISTILLALTLGVLIFYTVFTYKLKEATAKQTKLSLRPFVTFSYSRGLYYGNIGHSPALNVNLNPPPKFHIPVF